MICRSCVALESISLCVSAIFVLLDQDACLPACTVVFAFSEGFRTLFPKISGVVWISKFTHLIKLTTFCNSFGDLPKQFTSALHLAR